MNYILKLGKNLAQLVWLFQTNKKQEKATSNYLKQITIDTFTKRNKVGNNGIRLIRF